MSTVTNEAPKNEGMLLTEDEHRLITAVRAKDHRAAAVHLGRLAPPNYTYEQRAAFQILGRLATEPGTLSPDILDSPSANHIEDLIDVIAETLIDALHALGSVGTLAQILDHASSGMPDGFLDQQDGAE